MKGLYNIVFVMLCMVPMLSFLAASVVLVIHGHPYFAAASMIITLIVLPKIEIGGGCGDNVKKESSTWTRNETSQ